MQSGVDIMSRMETLISTNGPLLQHIEDSARTGDVLIRETRGISVGILDLAQRLDSNAKFDGRFRLFAQENLELVEPIHDAEPQQADQHVLDRTGTQERPGRVIRYRAFVRAADELSGSRVIVHTYPDRDKDHFVEAVKFAKQT
ncbi:hypothetical protein TRAPUB_8773 [Trametes pubescens]|uniref:Uncharacterized protein n=1 Tax=Trametes pubescens TaxID=154538 RepID=A0A1M2W4N3_TRAPU|nr:hypothetical protein TRAPUB_8773 [Trametes pubescens]